MGRSTPTRKFKLMRVKPGQGKGRQDKHKQALKAEDKENIGPNVDVIAGEHGNTEDPAICAGRQGEEGTSALLASEDLRAIIEEAASSEIEQAGERSEVMTSADAMVDTEESAISEAEQAQENTEKARVVADSYTSCTAEERSANKSSELYNDMDVQPPKMESRWHWCGQIGTGRIGLVKSKLCGGEVMAMLKQRAIDQEHNVCYAAVREVALLADVQHPNIQTLVDVFFEAHTTNLIREWAGIDLSSFLMQSQSGNANGLGVDVVRNLTGQLLSGLEFCHARGIVCRDIRPPNIFIDEACMRLRISGFALSRGISLPMQMYSPQVREIGHTVAYLSPEQLLGMTCYTPAVDIWAAGCVVAEMLSCVPLFKSEDNTQISTIFVIFRTLGTPSPKTWPEVQDACDFKVSFPQWAKREWDMIHGIGHQVGPLGCVFLDGLLQCNPRERSSARFALEHSWLKGAAGLTSVRKVSVLETLSKSPFLRPDALRLISEYLHPFPDVRLMPEYATDIIAHWKKQELVMPDHMRSQKVLNPQMHAILMDWLVSVNHKFQLRDETLFLAASFIDLFCAGRHIRKERYQLVGVVAMLIASKIQDSCPPSIGDFVHICDQAYYRREVEHMENVMLHVLRAHLGIPTTVHFLRRFMHVNRSDSSQEHCALYSATLALVHSSTLKCKYKPSLLAAASVMASNIATTRSQAWPAAMQAHTGYSELDLRSCVRELLLLFKEAFTANLQAVRKLFAKRLELKQQVI